MGGSQSLRLSSLEGPTDVSLSTSLVLLQLGKVTVYLKQRKELIEIDPDTDSIQQSENSQVKGDPLTAA